MITSDTPFRRIGGCSSSVWIDTARKLASPIPETTLRLMHDIADQHSALCLSQCVKESSLGRDSSAQRTKNPLGLMAADGATLLSFSTWENAVREWVRRITDLSYKSGVYAPENITLGQFLVTYVGGLRCWTTGGNVCANGETWDGALGGSVGLYITQTIERLNAYIGDVTMPDNQFRKPIIYSLDRDYSRYGLTSGNAAKILNHKFPARQGRKPMAMFLHIQEGNTQSSLSWWASGNADASATVMVQQDGSLLTVIGTQDAPWTNGDVQSPSVKGRALLSRIGNVNPNLVTLSIEMEGNSAKQISDPAVETICWQLTQWMTEFNLTKEDIYKHADINSVTRSHCPGAYWDQVMNRLSSGGTSPVLWPSKPSWLPDHMVKVLFPEADPAGIRTKAWMNLCASTGRAPRRIAFHGTGADQLIEFSDGSLIDSAGNILGRS